MAPRWRAGLRAAHRWLGLSLGLLLLLAGMTGTLLVFAPALDEALNPGLLRAPAGTPRPLADIVARLRQDFGPQAAFTLRHIGRPGASLQATVSGPWQGVVYLDPVSGRELGRRAAGSGPVDTVFQLHSSLYAGDTGRALLAAAALSYALMWISGLALWWPARWRGALRVRRASGLTAWLFDLHRVAGALLGALVLVLVTSGAYLAWKPLSQWVTRLSGTVASPPPAAPAWPASVPEAVLLDEAVARARVHWPGASVGAVMVPVQGRGAWRVRLRLADDPHPVGMSSVWLEPTSARIVAAQRWNELDSGTRAYSWLYPLHVGRLAGPAGWLLTLVCGLALTVHGGSGLWLWWRRAGPGRGQRRP